MARITNHHGTCIYSYTLFPFSSEWIAYHYHVINLRHLVIIPDPSSRTSPQRVIDRWKDLMTIELWNYTDYRNAKIAQKFSEHTQHQLRQNFFNRKCIRHFKNKDRGWVLMVDVDEFILLNPMFQKKGFENTNLSINKPGSVLSFLNQHGSKLKTCLTMYRRQITGKESSQALRGLFVPKFVNTSNLLTIRFLFQRDYKEEKEFVSLPEDVSDKERRFNFTKKCSTNRGPLPGKVVINLKQIRNIKSVSFIHSNTHRPIRSLCESPKIKPDNSPVIVNHYLPTWEQWNYRRNDARGFYVRAIKYHLFSMYPLEEVGTGVQLWVQGFKNSVGKHMAKSLLDGVGQLEPYPGQPDQGDILPHMPNFYRNNITNGKQMHQVGDWVNVDHNLAKIIAYQSNNHYYVITNSCEYQYDVAQERIQNIPV